MLREVKLTNYAQIPTELICRFGELSKTEIVVISYLYASRNRKSGKCNPSRSAVARAVQIDRAHVSPAFKSLEDKGWILEEPDGNFTLISEPAVVTKKARACRAESAQGAVRIPQQDCAESVTRVCGIRTAHIKESSEQRNEQKNEQRERERPAPLPSDFGTPRNLPPTKHNHPAIKAIRDITKHNPNKAIWDHLIDLLGDAPDLERLAACHRAWVLKGFKEINLAWVTEWYVDGIPERKTNGTGYKSKPSNSDIVGEWEQHIIDIAGDTVFDQGN